MHPFLKTYQKQLTTLSQGNEKYVTFSTKIINTKKKILGIRTPDFKKLVKNHTKTLTPQDLETFLMTTMRKNIYEDVALAAYFLAHIKMTDQQRIDLTSIWLKSVDTWALTDSDAKTLPKNHDTTKWWQFIQDCLKSPQEFTVRMGIMLIFSNYLEDPDLILPTLRKITHPGYYVKMALAWTYAELAITHFDRTLSELQTQPLDPWTVKKALTKMLESRRFTDHQKNTIRDLRKTIA